MPRDWMKFSNLTIHFERFVFLVLLIFHETKSLLSDDDMHGSNNSKRREKFVLEGTSWPVKSEEMGEFVFVKRIIVVERGDIATWTEARCMQLVISFFPFPKKKL